jgi:hypothetical protein
MLSSRRISSAYRKLDTCWSGEVASADGDVVGADAQQLQSNVTVTGDVCRERVQA